MFRSVRSRLVFYFLGLVSLVQIGVFVTLDITNVRLAREQVGAMLDGGVAGTRRAIERRNADLAETAKALAADPVLVAAAGRRDDRRVESKLQAQAARAGTDLMLVAGPDGAVLADASRRSTGGTLPAALRGLTKQASRAEGASKVVLLDEQPYRVSAAQIAVPPPSPSVVAGYALDNRVAEDLQHAMRLEVSFAVREADGTRRLVASSLPVMRRAALDRTIARLGSDPAKVLSVDMFGEEFLTRIVPLDGAGGGLEAVLQRSLSKELEAFDDLRAVVLFLSIGGLVVSVFGAFFIARTVTDPVLALAQAARDVAKGEYRAPAKVPAGDEVGELAQAFTGMVEGLAQRDRLRDVLGKVVPAEAAGKILANEVELGGEERVVTVLFADLRRLKAFAAPFLAQYSPRESLELLNVHLTRMAAVIEAHGGVVDKYLGSGIMAVFGAPVRHDDDAGNAIAAAIAMQGDLDALSAELAKNGLPRLGMGIGIDTGKVIAGNVGSPNRLGYTVIGDCVSFAARLEGLSANGSVDATILASAETMRRSRRRFASRPMAIQAARGASEPDLIYAVLGEATAEPDKAPEPVPA